MNSIVVLDPAFRELVERAITLAKAREETRRAGDTDNMHHFDRQFRNLVENASQEDQRKLVAVKIQGTVDDAEPQHFAQDSQQNIATGDQLWREVGASIAAGDDLQRGLDKLTGKKP